MVFHFALAAVLRLRESVEERERNRLEQLQHEIVQILQLLDKLDEQLAASAATREQAMRTALPAFHVQMIEDVRRSLKQQKKTLLQRLETAKAEREKQLHIYEAARRDREVLSEMRQRQWEAFQDADARRQQKTIDDLFGARHKRK